MILVSGIVHRRPDLVRDALRLYDAAMGGADRCHHVLHVNADAARGGFLDHLPPAPNLTINPLHLPTRRPSFLACHVHNLRHALRIGLAPTHVFLHLESDIPYRPGLGDHVRTHDLGLAVPRVFRPEASRGAWAPRVAADPHLRAFVAAHDDGAIRTSRYEGMFARTDLLLEVFAHLTAAWPMTDGLWVTDYPLEEFALPTVVEAVLAHRGLRRTRHAVLATASSRAYALVDREELREDHVPLLEAEPPEVFAAKFAPSDLASPVRAFARRALGI